jgi:hypothetical protein
MDIARTRYAEKIASIRAGAYTPADFILADAKDADVTGGILATGHRRGADGAPAGPRTRPEFLAQMAEVIAQDEIDILLASASNAQALRDGGAFDGTRVMPAFRANETTDIWINIRGGRYPTAESRPYRGADLAFAPAPLCLYSITFNNDVDRDVAALERYAAFRAEARAAGVQHFLEVFNPNRADAVADAEVGDYVADCITRLLASLTRAERPEFLKIAYNGARAMEALAAHDPSMIVGVLGGAGATHRDTFELLKQSEQAGARVALFGRKINQAEDQSAIITWMRRVVSGQTSPIEAVKGYHNDLAMRGLRPDRALDDDIEITADVLKS